MPLQENCLSSQRRSPLAEDGRQPAFLHQQVITLSFGAAYLAERPLGLAHLPVVPCDCVGRGGDLTADLATPWNVDVDGLMVDFFPRLK